MKNIFSFLRIFLYFVHSEKKFSTYYIHYNVYVINLTAFHIFNLISRGHFFLNHIYLNNSENIKINKVYDEEYKTYVNKK